MNRAMCCSDHALHYFAKELLTGSLSQLSSFGFNLMIRKKEKKEKALDTTRQRKQRRPRSWQSRFKLCLNIHYSLCYFTFYFLNFFYFFLALKNARLVALFFFSAPSSLPWHTARYVARAETPQKI